MEREVRTQTGRMAFVLVVFLGLAGWQFEFVMRSIEANIYLNMTIILTFVFGAFLAFRGVLSLGNELVALKALKVQYRDRGTEPEGCYDKPATVFSVPQLLGHAYRLISDELNKPKRMLIPQSTVKMLVEGVEVRIDDRKSAITYIVGLLVFLGLIGTFVGLMQTVGSVGDIIGSLNFGGESGESIDAAFQGLIADLKGPLVGMATGFSSSLFGLICSLTLGLMERFCTAANRIIPVEFESWLSNVVRIEETREDDEVQVDDTAADAITRLAKLEVKMRETAGYARKSTEVVGELLVSVHAMADSLSKNDAKAGYEALSELAREMAYTQRGFVEHLDATRERTALEQTNMQKVTTQISEGFEALLEDRRAQKDTIERLADSVEKMRSGGAGGSFDSAAPIAQMHEKLEAALQNSAHAAEPGFDQGANLFSYARRKLMQRALDKQAKDLRHEYHQMVREMLEKAFRRDGEIAAELDRIRQAESRNDATLDALVKHNQELQLQQRLVSNQIESLAKILADDQEDDSLLEEIKRSRLGVDLALRQISSQISHTRDAIETQAAVLDARASKDQRKAG